MIIFMPIITLFFAPKNDAHPPMHIVLFS
jgi:hypothetical protein